MADWNIALLIPFFILSLAVLVKSSDIFTDAAEKIGLKLKIPPFIIGVTLLALGTSLPELVTSIISVIKDSSEIVIGNVTGSNISNIFLILGCCAVYSKKMKINYDLEKVDLPLLIGSAFLFSIMVWDGKFTKFEAILSLIGFIIYIIQSSQANKIHLIVHKDIKEDIKKSTEIPMWKPWLMLCISGVLLYFGSNYTVQSIIHISVKLSIGAEIISASAVALGTSLPELMVSINAAKKGKPEMAVGNILGSNIFNTFAVMGIPGLMGTLVIPPGIVAEVVPIMVIATLVFYFLTLKKELTQWEGFILLLFYVLFIYTLFG
ncbi:MAG: calcium/sodium antiporter [bacterium]